MSWLSKLFIFMLGGAISGGLSALYVMDIKKPALSNQDQLNTLVPLKVEEESATVDVVGRATPAVVSIIVSKKVSNNATGPFIDDFFGNFFGPRRPPEKNKSEEGELRRVGGGSGFIVSSDGLILTNRHVVNDEKATYTVVFSDGAQLEAKVLARDPLSDIALVKVDKKDLPFITLGNSDSLQIGQTVIAIGFALGEFQNSVTKGIISGIDRRVVAGDGFQSGVIEGALQTDAAINQGNSGGPLINLAGQVVGINTAVSREGQLIGFAIPSNAARTAVDSVKLHGRIIRPWMGIRYAIITPEFAKLNDIAVERGALVLPGTLKQPGVIKGSPAAKAGIKERDIIVKIDGKEINQDTSIASIIASKQVGDKLALQLNRDGKLIDVSVTLEELNEKSFK